ncbi:hypothetical protein LUZ60_010157 [Juncus effusus]|nr:hypothetical protein LUZ60_010157 [Juncus effusus]
MRVFIGNNKFHGDISEYFGVYPHLYKIDLSYNQFSGQLSSSWGQCSNLTYLNIGGNNISGAIPREIGNLNRLVELDLSSNYLTGAIPKEFGKLESLYKLNLSDNNLIGDVPSEIGMLSRLQSLDLSSNRLNLVPQELDGKDAYDDIIRVTDNFDEKYCIGYGGNGRVYKAILQRDITVAVKKLQFASDESTPHIQAFENEISTLTQIRHRNIVKLYVHRDITSKNILLDSEFKAKVSDFGIAKFLKPDSSNWSMLAGTFGYMAPELAYTSRVTEKCDVYSCGVVVMELFMGKHPGDVNQMINIKSQNIGDNAWLLDIADQRLPIPTDKEMKEVERITKIAFKCLDSNPISRPSMQQVVKCFELQ